VADAEVYFTDRLDATGWTNGTSVTKPQALVTATSLIDSLPMLGVAASDIQLLAFPRSGYYFDPVLGRQVEMSGFSVRLLKATYELANHLLDNSGVLDDTGSVDGISLAGGLDIREISPPSKIPRLVLDLLRPLRANNGANAWWRAN
jgi:hypothetical protein